MRTLHQVRAGRVVIVLRSDGSVYATDPTEYEIDRSPKIVATSAAGCEAVADALREVAAVIRQGGTSR